MGGIEYFYHAWEKLGTTRSATLVEFTLPTCPPPTPPPIVLNFSCIENNAYAKFCGEQSAFKTHNLWLPLQPVNKREFVSKNISPLENLIDFKVPLSFIGWLQMKSSSLAFLESREGQCTRQDRLPHVFLGISYGKIIVFKTGILKSPGDEKLVSLWGKNSFHFLSVFKQNAIYKYEGELWPQSIQVNIPDSVIKNSMDAPESKAS